MAMMLFPEMFIDPTELARFEECAANAGAQFVQCLLIGTHDASVASSTVGRFGAGRPVATPTAHSATIEVNL
jgi:hypothetical protein